MTTTAQITPADHRKPWRYTAPDQTVTAGVETITPELASDYLEAQYTNRPLSQDKIREYARTLEAGRWTLTGESVIFNTRAQLIDGQHRCWACIIAGVPFETIVVRGIKTEAFDDLGSGKQRSAADVLAIHGFKDASRLAATVNFTLNYLAHGSFERPDAHLRADKRGILTFAEAHPGILESNRHGGRKGFHFRGTSNTLVSAIHYLTSTAEPDEAPAFWEQFESGANLADTSPIYHLRRRLASNGESHERLDQPHIGALIIKTWNLWLAGKQIGLLTWKPGGATAEPYPQIKGL